VRQALNLASAISHSTHTHEKLSHGVAWYLLRIRAALQRMRHKKNLLSEQLYRKRAGTVPPE